MAGKKTYSDNDVRRHLDNKRFGRLLVIRCVSDRTVIKGYSRLKWEVQCDCGNKRIVSGYNLLRKGTRSCGCYRDELLRSRKLDLLGKKFGRLLVTKFLGIKEFSSGCKNTMWECVCDCGNKINVCGSYLNSLKKTSCGCSRKTYKLKRDFTGIVFDDWTVICRAENRVTPNGQSRPCWKCENSKGETKIVFSTYIFDKLKTPSRKKDYCLKRFGKLRVLFEVDWNKTPEIEIHNPDGTSKIYTRKEPSRYWWCECECGNRVILTTHKLKNSLSCGCDCVRGDYVGRRYGKLVVLSYAGHNSNGANTWLCQCDCGKQKVVTSKSLQSGTRSCGCNKRKPHKVNKKNHLLR